jgi:hypothetical protein
MKRLFLVVTVALFATIAFSQTRIQIFPKELPKNSTNYITRNYPDYTINKAYKVDTKTVITYEVLISIPGNPKSAIVLIFDSPGNFIKKVNPKTDPAPKPANKPTTDPKK